MNIAFYLLNYWCRSVVPGPVTMTVGNVLARRVLRGLLLRGMNRMCEIYPALQIWQSDSAGRGVKPPRRKAAVKPLHSKSPRRARRGFDADCDEDQRRRVPSACRRACRLSAELDPGDGDAKHVAPMMTAGRAIPASRNASVRPTASASMLVAIERTSSSRPFVGSRRPLPPPCTPSRSTPHHLPADKSARRPNAGQWS